MTRQMKNSGVRWIGDIPSNWSVSRIKYIANNEPNSFTDGDWIESPYITDNGIRYLTSGNVGEGKYKRQGNGYISEQTFNVLGCKFAYPGDLIFSRLNAPFGRSCILPDDEDRYVIAVDNVILRTNEDKRYVCYFTQTAQYQQFIELLCDGMAMQRIARKKLGDISIPLPPLTEQKAIADFLDTKCAEIDGLLADLDAEVKTLTEYKKSIISETVTHGLNPNAQMKSSGIPWADTIPAHWAVDKGKFCFELRRTKGNPRNLELMSPTQKFGVIPQSQLEGVVLVKENTDLNTFRTIRKGDFCISLRSFQGGFEYSNYEGVVSPAYQVFYPIKPIADGYFKYIFKSDGFISYINTFSMSLRDGKNIAFEDFGNSYIPIPPIEEQEAIANYLNSKCAAIEKSITDKLQQMETLKSYKSSLIYEYVTGKKQVI